MGLDAKIARLLKPDADAKIATAELLKDSELPSPGIITDMDDWTVYTLEPSDDMRCFRFVLPYVVVQELDRPRWNVPRMLRDFNIPDDALISEVEFSFENGDVWILRKPDHQALKLSKESWRLPLKQCGGEPGVDMRYTIMDKMRYVFVQEIMEFGYWESRDGYEVQAMRKGWRDEHSTGVELDTYHPLNDTMRAALVECGYSKEDLKNTEDSIVCYYENY